MSITEFKHNNLKIIHNHRPNSKMVDVRITLGAGNFYNSLNKLTPGLVHFLEHVVHEKTQKYNNKSDLTMIIEKYGGYRNAITYSNEKMVFFATVLKEYTENAFDYVSQVVFNSMFDDQAVEKHRKIIKEELLASFKTPYTKSYNLFNSLAYKNTNFIYHTLGTEESLDEITLKSLKSFYNNFFIPGNCILSVAGDIDLDQCKDLVNKYFSNEDNNERPLVKEGVNIDKLGKQQGHVFIPEKQAVVNIGGVFDGINSDKYFSKIVLLRILSGSSNAILNKKLREEMNLVYSISGVLIPNKIFSSLFFNLNVQPENIQKSIDIIKEEVYKISNGDISDDNIDMVKKKVLAGEVFNNQSVEDETDGYVNIKFMFDNLKNRDEFLQKIIEVTKEDIVNSAKELINNLNILAVCSNIEGVKYEF